MTVPETAKAVTIVTQTRVSPGKDDAFAKWQQRMGALVAKQSGFVKETVMPPSPPTQVDWVILQRFASSDAATAWLRSAERQRLVTEAQPILVGQDDVHLVADAEEGALPAPVSAVISTRIKPGQEDAYREWGRRIAAAQGRRAGPQPGPQAALSVNIKARHRPARHRIFRISDMFDCASPIDRANADDGDDAWG